MPKQSTKNSDLHGSAPDSFHTALLIIDVINDMKFENGIQIFMKLLTAHFKKTHTANQLRNF
ncbi:hypothetical protein [Bacillus taeanensis]|uniref:hypothetical protein n=1 Tax=Bacillus taeanensis TaxID=273032 RepID=UPI001FE4EF8D|nr:hypothetical protein [Bacillus taeanensis]